MRIILEDENGDIREYSGEEIKEHITCGNATQNFFTPCQGCDKIVLSDLASFEDPNGPFCRLCSKKGD